MKNVWYSETEEKMGIVPLESGVRLDVCGSPEEVERALDVLMNLYSLHPVTSIGWDSLGRAAEGDPLRASLLVEIRDLKKIGDLRKGHFGESASRQTAADHLS